MAQFASFQKRQVNEDPSSPAYCPWYYCDEKAIIIKWIIVAAVIAIIAAFFIGGYYHAKKRMAKGLPPLRYHRFLVSRQARERFPTPREQQHGYWNYPQQGYGHGAAQSYQMHSYGQPAPPPAYHEAEAVPVYTPPTKVNPDQSYAPPPGAPASYNPHAGSSNLAAPPSQPPRVASPSYHK